MTRQYIRRAPPRTTPTTAQRIKVAEATLVSTLSAEQQEEWWARVEREKQQDKEIDAYLRRQRAKQRPPA